MYDMNFKIYFPCWVCIFNPSIIFALSEGFLDGWSLDNINTVIISVVRYTNWPPSVIDEMYLDDLDHHGLLFWYNDIKEQDKAMKKTRK